MVDLVGKIGEELIGSKASVRGRSGRGILGDGRGWSSNWLLRRFLIVRRDQGLGVENKFIFLFQFEFGFLWRRRNRGLRRRRLFWFGGSGFRRCFFNNGFWFDGNSGSRSDWGILSLSHWEFFADLEFFDFRGLGRRSGF